MADEFELSVLDLGNPTRATVVARCGFDMAIESFSELPLQPLLDFHKRLSEMAAGRLLVKPTALELAQFGQNLFNLVVRDGIKQVYGRLPASHIRLQIYSNRSDLQAIPWEYIQQPGGIAGPNSLRPIIRVVPTVGLPAPEPRKLNKTIRVLFAYAEPTNQPSVDWPTMKDTIEDRFNAQLPDQLALDVVEGATTDSFRKAFRNKKYDILHIVCHGEITNGIGYLLFQDIRGSNKELISAADLATLLQDKELGLVVLSACETATGDFSKEFATVAKTLVQAGIPAVVANQFKIDVTAAAAFAGEFYSELLGSGDVDRATSNGRLALVGKTTGAEVARIDWGIPVLYRHLGGAKVFTS